MEAHIEAIVKSLVAVAWADGRMEAEELEVLEAMVSAFELSAEDADSIRQYARERRGLDDVPLTDLSADDRRLLLQHAVIITYVDGEQSADEVELLKDLVKRLRIPQEEADAIIAGADKRAKRLMKLL